MPQTVEVRFKGTRRDFFSWKDDGDLLRLKEGVIVEAERGSDFGRVSAVGEVALKKCGTACNGCAAGTAPPDENVRNILRRATQQDIKAANDLRRLEEDVRRTVIDRVRHHDLAMKVSDAEWQWDRRKLTIFFTADHRVDFRSLVRDLARHYRTRIDLRQIGVRDEAARLSGVGRCGREYCCSSWLTELSPVSLSLAKDQRLALNPSQISGGCGRLLCCLKYEHDFYVTSRKRFPKEGKELVGARGPERVVAIDIFRERILLQSQEHGTRVVSLVALKEETAARRRAPEPKPAPPTATAADTEATTDAPEPPPRPRDKSRRRRRRRRRRGGGGGGGRDGPPSGPGQA